jgi:hypothetical protein
MSRNGEALRGGADGTASGVNAGLDAVVGRVMAELLGRSHLLTPGAIGDQLAETARPLGVSGVCIYLADVEQQSLRPMTREDGEPAEVLSIDSTIAGRAYRTITVQHLPAADGDAHRVWIPLVDGTERLGVLYLLVRDVSEPMMLDCYRTLASLVGQMIMAKSSYSDAYVMVQRRQEMSLQAELVWAFLPPRTFATERVLIAATLEPAYEVGGDAFDYALIGERLHVSIFDSVGHDLASGLLASVGMASCRSTRRSGGSLPDIFVRADHAIASQFGRSRFVTALLCDLDTATGEFSWIPCGHPPPLLIRRNKVIKELTSPPQLPLGIAHLDSPAGQLMYRGEPDGESAVPVQTEQLEPGDRLLLYTDGVTEGRAADGTPFGVRRLGDFVIRHSSAGTPVPETLRRLNRAIIEYQHGRLQDDATIVLVEWLPDHPAHKLTP